MLLVKQWRFVACSEIEKHICCLKQKRTRLQVKSEEKQLKSQVAEVKKEHKQVEKKIEKIEKKVKQVEMQEKIDFYATSHFGQLERQNLE